MSKVSKVVLGNDTIMDITDSTVTENNLLDGEVAYGSDGERVVGRAVIPTVNDGVLTIQKNGTTVQTFSANQSTDVTANITVPTTASDVGAIPTTQKGVASGVAELDSTGKVPSSQLPSYVDDTIEGYLYNGHWYSDAEHTQEVVGETGKIYVELSTNKTYRWSGTTFVEISESLALGETSSTAYRGDRGATAYSHATDANKVSSATATGLYKVGATAEGHISELQAVQKSDITNLGIPGAVKLTITVSESEDPQTGDEVLVADKTPSEVLAALNSGTVVEAVYEGRVCSIAQNLLSSSGRILFGVTVGGDNVGLFFNGLMFIKDSQDDAWESITLMNSNATQRLNASIDYSNNTYSCDYTYDEFESARSNGQEILVEYDNVIYYFTKYDSSEYTYYFSSTLADSDGTTTNTFVMVGDDSTGDWDSITLTESSGGSANSFLVRVYEDPQTQQTTCDKLPSEILAAYTNGSIIQAKIELEGEDAMLDLASCMLSSSPYLAIFSTLVTRQNNDTVTLSLHLQKDSSSDTWEDIDIYQSDLCHYVGNISHSANGYYFDITPSMFDDAISYSLGARIKYVDSDNDVTYDFYLSRYDESDSEHTVFYLTSVNADSTGETTILTFALYPDWELDDWDNIVLYETNGSGDIIWTGTQAEYEAQASQIPVGAYVNITDDEQIIPYASAIRWEEARTSVKKNWLNHTTTTQTVSGVTFTVNADRSITVSGTASADINLFIPTGIKFKAGDSYIFTAGKDTDDACGAGNKCCFIRFVNGSTSWIGSWNTVANRTFTVTTESEIGFGFYIANGQAVSTTFYPMVRLTSIVDNTYVPYVPDNTELVDWKSNGILGAKNLIDAPSTLSYSASAEASRSFGTLYLTVGDSIIVTANQMGAVTSVERNTITITRPNSAGTVYENTSSNYHIGSGLHKLKYVATETGIHDFKVWVKNPNTAVNFNQFMVRYSSDSDDTYQPYTKTNRQLTEDVYADMDWASNNVLGAKNLMPNLLTSQVINGLTVTVNDDGTITINGTCTVQTSLGIIPSTQGMQYLAPLFKLGKLTISNTGIGGSRGQFNLFLHDTVAGNKNFGAWGVDVTYDFSPYANTVDSTNFSLIILKDAVFNNETVTPMIRLAADTDGTYTPYAKTNQQLTTDSVDWDNGKISVKKNYLNLKHLRPNQTYTHSGITYTYNGDGTITANGTATSDSYWYFITGLWIYIPNGQYVLNGSIGGSNNTYQLRLNYYNTSGTIVEAPTSRDGDSGIFALNSSRTGDLLKINCYIFVYSGQVLDNVVFKPMLRALSVIDDSFDSYVPSNNELLSYSDNTLLGAKNWLPCDLSYMRIVNTTGTSWSNNVCTVNGVTFTINADGTITANGTATGGRADIYLQYNNIKSGLLANTLYTLTGCPSGGSNTKYCMQYWNNSTQSGNNDFGDGCDFYLSNASNQVTFLARVYENQTVSNLTFKPMIRLATDTDNTYVPYTPSNRDLFAKIAPIKIEAPIYTSSTFSQIVKTILDNIVDGGNYQLRSFMGGFVWSGNDHYTLEGFFGSRYARGMAYTKDTVYWFNYDSNTKQLSAPTSIAPGTLPVWSSSVSALTGATSVTITNANIHTSSVIEPFADNGTNTAMSMPTMTVTEGQCVLGFDALTADTTFKLRITN